MTGPALDIIVPVHDARRPVARLAASVLSFNTTPLRLTFVCHGLGAGPIADALGPVAADPRVRLIEFDDGERSPAGPFLEGLARATAPLVMKIDSDDTLEPGAVDAWMRLARAHRADIVICRMRSVSADREWATPPVRPIGHRRRDPIKDRLSYRTSTMGIIDRELMRTAPPVRGIRTGEDIESSIRLWFSGATIVLADSAPAYLVHDDGSDRATAPRGVVEEFAWLEAMRASGYAADLPLAARRSIGTKLIRVQLFGAVTARTAHLTEGDLVEFASIAATLAELSGGIPPWLSRADHDLLAALLGGRSAAERIVELAARRRRFGSPVTILPPRLRWTLHREAPVRMMLATFVASRRRTRRRTG